MSSSVPHVDEERWDRNRARQAFARFAELRANRELDSGPDHSGVSEFDRLRNELHVATCIVATTSSPTRSEIDAAIAAGRADLVLVAELPAK